MYFNDAYKFLVPKKNTQILPFGCFPIFGGAVTILAGQNTQYRILALSIRDEILFSAFYYKELSKIYLILYFTYQTTSELLQIFIFHRMNMDFSEICCDCLPNTFSLSGKM